MKKDRLRHPFLRPTAVAIGALALCAGSSAAVAAMTETTLHAFSASDGSPSTVGPALAVAGDGNYYGAVTGGSSGNGAIYRLTPAGSFTIVHSFTGGADGGQPNGLVLGKNGKLYGTTANGGSKSLGTAFSLTTGGTFKTLHNFNGVTDGRFPNSPLMQASDGDFYGTTLAGGLQEGGIITGGCPLMSGEGSQYKGCGTVYRMTVNGGVKVLHKFDFKNGDGWIPTGVMQASDGNLYGTTQDRGIDSGGIAYRLSLDGSSYQILVGFGGSNGYAPLAPPLQGIDGVLYGMTAMGGIGAGNVYSLTLSGSLGNVFSFPAGGDPATGLVQNPNTGLIYGATGQWLLNGVIYSVTSAGSYNTEYSFTGGADGGWPQATLVPANAGQTSYLGTNNAGANGYGTVFQLTVQ